MNSVQHKIIEVMERFSSKGRGKVSPVELARKLGLPQRVLRKEVKGLIDSQLLAYWSSGSSSYIMLQRHFKNLKTADEMPLSP